VDCVRLGRIGFLATLAALLLGAYCGAVAHATPRHASASHCANSSSFRASHTGTPAHKQHRHCSKRAPRPHAPCTNTKLVPNGSDLRAVRAATLCLVNRERAVHGERALVSNLHLERAAQGHADSMGFSDYFDHVGPGGQTPLSRMRAAGYIYSSRIGFEIGENIAWGTLWLGTPKAIVAGWMASPGHRANILDSRFRETAIGVSPHPPVSLAHGQAGGVYTQDFGVLVR
jgi:uncharacterized protein YkwD